MQNVRIYKINLIELVTEVLWPGRLAAWADITSWPKLRTIKLLTFCQFAEGIFPPLSAPFTPFWHFFCTFHIFVMCTRRKLPCATSASPVPWQLAACSFPVCLHYFALHFFNLLIYFPLFVHKLQIE